MSCGYGAASLSERLYAWRATPDRTAAAGLLICTTASDSEGTLGGLVALSEPDRLRGIVTRRAAPRRPLLLRPRLRPTRTAATRKTSSTARPATAAASPPKPRANVPTGSSTAGSCSPCPPPDGDHVPGFFGDAR